MYKILYLNILPIGTSLPFTVTLSTRRTYSYIFSLIMFINGPDINISTSNCRVAASSRAAIFTFGDKYDASILNSEPIAPFKNYIHTSNDHPSFIIYIL